MYLSYDKYSRILDDEENFINNPESCVNLSNFNRINIKKEDFKDKQLKNCMEFMKIYYEKYRISLNSFTCNFQDKINVNCYLKYIFFRDINMN